MPTYKALDDDENNDHEERLSTGDNNDDGESDDSGDEDSPCLCTFAVTGETPVFQAILVCLDCSSDEEGVCLCRACAELCHAGHEIDYIGMGPSYCDCQQLSSCRLQEASEMLADKLSLSSKGIQHTAPSLKDETQKYIQEVFTISSLDERSCDRLVREAAELVKHSKDTHWLELNNDDEPNQKKTKLEGLALTILQRHIKEYQLSNNDNDGFQGGAEWWVQVKPITNPTESSSRLDHDDTTNGDEAVDLHYDKDEVLAENFDLGAFPTLSTVTYLTATPSASPTVVFPHTYNTDQDEVMDEMLLSWPRRGKHLVFDGRLLHGAPAHHALRSMTSGESNEKMDEFRVTFLVNIWDGRKPCDVEALSTEVRQKVRAAGKKKTLSKILQQSKPTATTDFENRLIESVRLDKEEDLPEAIRGRIELPFVSKGATWISRVRGNGLVVVTFPPPPTQAETIRVKFGAGLQAYLEYQYEDETEEQERFNIAGDLVDYV